MFKKWDLIMQREKLIKQLGNLVKPVDSGISHKLSYTMKRWELELVADFILEDRKRIVAPLVKVKSLHEGYHNALDGYDNMNDAIDETLSLALLDKG